MQSPRRAQCIDVDNALTRCDDAQSQSAPFVRTHTLMRERRPFTGLALRAAAFRELQPILKPLTCSPPELLLLSIAQLV